MEYTLTDFGLTSYYEKMWGLGHEDSRIEKNNGSIVLSNDTNEDYSVIFDMSTVQFNLDYIKKDKYSYVGMVFIMNNAMKLSTDNDGRIRFTKSDIENFINVSIRDDEFSKYKYGIEGLLYMALGYKTHDGGMKKSSFIASVEVNYKDSPDGIYTVTIGEWHKDLVLPLEYKNNKFIKGTVDYSGYISNKAKRTESISIPQKIVNLYRVNQNKEMFKNREYKVIDYLFPMWEHRKRLQKRDIIREIEKLNNALINFNIILEFNIDMDKMTPSKFKKSKFKIVEI